MADPHCNHDWLRALGHRWLVQYNPLYLVSAAVTLAGVIALSQGVAAHGGFMSQIGITAIAELYAWALIGSAALLMRCHRRRAATMLGLLAVFYAGDPTLHTATSPMLGDGGALASAVWLLAFGLKVRALAWAVRLRLSRSATAVLALGAALVALGPWLLTSLPAEVGSNLVVTWLFVVLAAAAWTRRQIVSRVPLDAWAGLVARRSIRGAWWGMGAMLLAHVSFWGVEFSALDPMAIVPVVGLLTTRVFLRERKVWALLAAVLVGVAHEQPTQLWLIATMASAVLGLHAVRAPLEARRRLLVGAGVALYLAAWSLGYFGGAWPAHVLGLDAALLAAGLLARRYGVGLAVVPGLATWSHAAITEGWVHAPTTTTGWGITGIVAGFALLGVAVVASLRIRAPAEPT